MKLEEAKDNRAPRFDLHDARVGAVVAKGATISKPTTVDQLILNLSKTGLLFRSEEAYSSTTELDLLLDFPVFNNPVACRARVAWSKPLEREADFQVAVEFENFKSGKDKWKVERISSNRQLRYHPRMAEAPEVKKNYLRLALVMMLICLMGYGIFIWLVPEGRPSSNSTKNSSSNNIDIDIDALKKIVK